MFGSGRDQGVHVTELLSAYLDKQLNRQDRARVETHLSSCPTCAEDLRSLQATVRVLASLPVAALPRSFILQPQLQKRPSLRWLPLLLRLATVATALALLLSIGGDFLLGTTRTGAVPTYQAGFNAAPAPTQAAAAPLAPAAQERTTQGVAPATPATGALPVTSALSLAPSPASTEAAIQDSQQPSTDTLKIASAPAAPTPQPATGAALAAPAPTGTPPGPPGAGAPTPTAMGTAVPTNVVGLGGPPETPAPAAVASPAPTRAAGPGEASPTASLPSEIATPAAAPAPSARPTAGQPVATSPFRPLELGLAGLLVVLVAATIAVSRRQK